jgi:hypothetical protein
MRPSLERRSTLAARHPAKALTSVCLSRSAGAYSVARTVAHAKTASARRRLSHRSAPAGRKPSGRGGLRLAPYGRGGAHRPPARDECSAPSVVCRVMCLAGPRQPGVDAFTNALPLELRERAEHIQMQLAGGRRRLNASFRLTNATPTARSSSSHPPCSRSNFLNDRLRIRIECCCKCPIMKAAQPSTGSCLLELKRNDEAVC